MKNTIKNAGCGQLVHYQCVKNCALIPSLLFLVIVCVPAFSYAASFDCAKASTNVEKLICSDKKLGFYDEKLNRAYNDLRALSNDKNELRKEQLSWLKNIRNKCAGKSCLSVAYYTRIEELKEKLKKLSYAQAPKNKLEYYLSLANDDDPVTGVWSDYREGSRDFYRLYEKIDGRYKVTYCSSRETVTTWPGRVEVSDNKISIWNYNIVDETIKLEETNSFSYFVKDGELYRNQGTGSAVSMFFSSEEQIKEMVSCAFTTGQKYLEDSLQTLIENSTQTEVYSILSDSVTLSQYGDINSVSEVVSLEKNSYQYFLFQVSLGYPPRSGYCGSSEDRGYYWVKVNKSTIEDDWLFTSNECRRSSYVIFDQEKYLFKTVSIILGEEVSMPECFISVQKDISNKPQPCDRKLLKNVLFGEEYVLYADKIEFYGKYKTREDLINGDIKYAYHKDEIKNTYSRITFALAGIKEKSKDRLIPLEVMPDKIKKILMKRSELIDRHSNEISYLQDKKPEDTVELEYLVKWVNAWHEEFGTTENEGLRSDVLKNNNQVFDPVLP